MADNADVADVDMFDDTSPFEEGASDTAEDSSTDTKEADTVVEDTKAETPDVPVKETEGTEEKAEEGSTAPDAEETEAEAPKAEARKQQLNTEIRDLVAKRNELKVEVEKANAEVYQPATSEELVEQGMTELEAKVEAMRQEQEMDKFNSRVAEAQLTISHEADKVLTDFPIFNPESNTYDEELATEAAQLLEANLIKDPNTNQVIGSNVSPYQLYKTFARAAGISATKGQIQGQKNTEKMLANADAPSGATKQKAPEKDPIMAIWDSDD